MENGFEMRELKSIGLVFFVVFLIVLISAGSIGVGVYIADHRPCADRIYRMSSMYADDVSCHPQADAQFSVSNDGTTIVHCVCP